MAYGKQTWVNRESQANATRLNHIEDGIYNAYNVSLIAITNIQPSECNTGDKYFNTTDNLIYTATGTNTWSETGETPISDKTYVLTSDGSTYMYNGTTLTRIGGGQVENEYSESTTLPYSANYINGIVESGSNENGNYVKYIDGTMVCYGVAEVYNDGWSTVYYPVEFISQPTVIASVASGSSETTTIVTAKLSGISTTTFRTSAVISSGYTSALINYIAIGKWE